MTAGSHGQGNLPLIERTRLCNREQQQPRPARSECRRDCGASQQREIESTSVLSAASCPKRPVPNETNQPHRADDVNRDSSTGGTIRRWLE